MSPIASYSIYLGGDPGNHTEGLLLFIVNHLLCKVLKGPYKEPLNKDVSITIE